MNFHVIKLFAFSPRYFSIIRPAVRFCSVKRWRICAASSWDVFYYRVELSLNPVLVYFPLLAVWRVVWFTVSSTWYNKINRRYYQWSTYIGHPLDMVCSQLSLWGCWINYPLHIVLLLSWCIITLLLSWPFRIIFKAGWELRGRGWKNFSGKMRKV